MLYDVAFFAELEQDSRAQHQRVRIVFRDRACCVGPFQRLAISTAEQRDPSEAKSRVDVIRIDGRNSAPTGGDRLPVPLAFLDACERAQRWKEIPFEPDRIPEFDGRPLRIVLGGKAHSALIVILRAFFWRATSR